MSFRAKPPQVEAECDVCGAELEWDGIHIYFDADTAAEDVRDYEWGVVDGKLFCEECMPPPPDECGCGIPTGSRCPHCDAELPAAPSQDSEQ